MQRSVLHIVVILLLAVLYIGERAMPCVDAYAGECAAGSHADPTLSSDHQEEHGQGAGASEKGHDCDHCSCPCHIPALSTQGERALSVFYSEREYTPEVYPLPSASVHPPDHVPLA